jgi:hypothetical protein
MRTIIWTLNTLGRSYQVVERRLCVIEFPLATRHGSNDRCDLHPGAVGYRGDLADQLGFTSSLDICSVSQSRESSLHTAQCFRETAHRGESFVQSLEDYPSRGVLPCRRALG